jgi:hypothetical protein
MAVLLLLGSMLSGRDSPEAKGWRGIRPLRSTRADVERLLGQGSNWCKCSYYLTDVNVFFVYSSEDCKTGGSGGWNVPPNSVLRITVHMKPAPRLSDLGVDLTKFKKRRSPHIEKMVTYVDDEDGLAIEVDEERNLVMALDYVPAAEDKHLRCP